VTVKGKLFVDDLLGKPEWQLLHLRRPKHKAGSESPHHQLRKKLRVPERLQARDR
jgi:hypothetical protein